MAWASWNDTSDVCRLLFETDHFGLGLSQLHLAAARGDEEGTVQLLTTGAGVNAADEFGYTPLWVAVRREHVDVLKLLLRHDADPNAMIGRGLTPLRSACTRAHEMEQYCEKANCLKRRDPELGEAVIQAAILKIQLLAYAARLDQEGDTPLRVAVREGMSETAAILREHGASEEPSPMYTSVQGEEGAAMDAGSAGRIAELCKILGDRERGIERITAVQELIQIGAPAVPALLRLLEDQRPRARTDAATALSSMGEAGKAAIPALEKMANDPNPAVSMGARMALKQLKAG